MKDDQTNLNNIQEESIDLIPYLREIWASKSLILKITIISFVLGTITALLSPIVYESQTTFVPQTSDQNQKQGLGSLASLAGINLNMTESSSLDNYISPLLYSKIASSDEFSLNLINEEVSLLNGEKLTIKDYLKSDSNDFNISVFLKKYTIDLFKSSKNNLVSNDFESEYNFISDDDYSLVQLFKGKFTVEANKKEGYIKVSGQDESAFVSTQIVKLVTQNLQSRIISVRTNKIKEQLDYSKKEYLKKKNEFEILQNEVAEFRDSNKNISTAVFLSELQKLESEYALQQNILTSLAAEYNNNKIKLNKDTPIFSVLDEVSVPNKRLKPKRKIIVIIFLLLGFISSVFYILTKEIIWNYFERIKGI